MSDNEQIITNQQLVTLTSAIVQRAALATAMGRQFNGDRDVYDAVGYKKTLQVADYQGRYQRQDIAGRIVSQPPADTWKKPPAIFDGEVSTKSPVEEQTEFLKSWNDVARRLRVWHWFERVDRLAGIGRFGVLLIGAGGGTALKMPIKSNKRVLYLSAFSERLASVKRVETNARKERFGLPEMYDIKLGDEMPTTEVHYSRVIHVAEDLEEDEIYGTPRLQRCYNLLDDLLKIVAGGSEATWRVMDRGLHANVDPEIELDDDMKDAIKEQVEEYIHSLRRFLTTQGVDLNTLGGEVVDPTGLFEIITSLLSATSGIPRRILLGSERGELASSQDQENWAGVIASRQRKYAEPVILRPLIDRLIEWGALPEPQAGAYEVGELGADGLRYWPPIFEVSEKERAEIGKLKAETQRTEFEGAVLPIISRWREQGHTEEDIDQFIEDVRRGEAEMVNGDFIPKVKQ